MCPAVRITEGEEFVVAYDPDAEVASQGRTREAARANLSEALQLQTEFEDVGPGDRDVPTPEVEWF